MICLTQIARSILPLGSVLPFTCYFCAVACLLAYGTVGVCHPVFMWSVTKIRFPLSTLERGWFNKLQSNLLENIFGPVMFQPKVPADDNVRNVL